MTCAANTRGAFMAIRLVDAVRRWDEAQQWHHPKQGEDEKEAVRRLIGSECYWVSEDMMTLIEHAAKEMPGEEFYPTDVPSKSGFVCLSKDINLRGDDGKQKTLPVSAWSWGVDDEAKNCSITLWINGRPVTTESVPFGSSWEEIQSNKPRKSHGSDLKNVLAHMRDPDFVDRVMNPRPGVFEISFMRFPKALWTISQQRLADIETYQPPRYIRRQLAKAGSALADRMLKVVRLRRATYAAHGGSSDVEWTHRWLVNGHWRNQWLPSVENHRLQYIMPYVKGPEDKPFVPKRVLNMVNR